MSTQIFQLGQIVATPGALAWLEAAEVTYGSLLDRHTVCDWGDLSEDDKAANNSALQWGGRLLSSYLVADSKVWIITEWDRSVTTLLMADEY